MYQETIDMQILRYCEYDCIRCRWVSCRLQSSVRKAVAKQSHRVGAARNSGRSRKQQQKPTQLQLGSETQSNPLPVQVISRSRYFRYTCQTRLNGRSCSTRLHADTRMGVHAIYAQTNTICQQLLTHWTGACSGTNAGKDKLP